MRGRLKFTPVTPRMTIGSSNGVAILVEDQEAAGATLDFVVTLSRARHEATTVHYATSDGMATADADYTAAEGMPTFAQGERQKTVSVAVLDDLHDDTGEDRDAYALDGHGADRHRRRRRHGNNRELRSVAPGR